MKRALALCLLAGVTAGCGDDNPASSSASTESSSSSGAGATGASSAGGGGPGGASSGGAATGGSADCAPIDLSGASQAVTLPAGCPGGECASIGLTPFTERTEDYLGVPAKLYCGSNTPPAGYAEQGIALGQGIEPLDAAGMPDPGGKYALVSIGMSNTTQEYSRFISKYENDPSLAPNLVLVDGALGGHATPQWIDPNNEVWTNLTQRLEQRGVSDAQVTAVWVKQARQSPQAQCDAAGFQGMPCFPAHEQLFADELRTVLGMVSARFPNLKLVYLSNRIYAGFASSDLNPEPYAYQSAIVVKKIVMEKILEDSAASGLPWLGWGPYLWADGMTPREDGLTWPKDHLREDGTHPSDLGTEVVADMLFEFFSTDPTSAPWFLAAP